MNRRDALTLAGAVILAAGRTAIGATASRDRMAPLIQAAHPILTVLERFRADHGAYPNPGDETDVRLLTIYPLAPFKVSRIGRYLRFQEASSVTGWLYERAERDPSIFSLSLKLGWDPRLVYRHEGRRGQWIVDPGDGSPEQPVESEM